MIGNRDEKPRATRKQRPDTKEIILLAAFAEFSEKGLEGSRVDGIAELAGVNKAMLYYHFSSKENLYQEAIRHHLTAATATLHKIFDESAPIEDLLRQAARQYARIFSTNPQFTRILLRELANPEGEMIRRVADLVVQSSLPIRLRQRMNDEMKAGRWRDCDVKQLIVTFISLNIGYFLLSPLVNRVLTIDDQGAFVKERADLVVDVFLKGVTKA